MTTISATRGVLWHGDNLDVLRAEIAAASVDLVYLDPPFNSEARYAMRRTPGRSAGAPVAFSDRWRWDAAVERALRACAAADPAADRVLSGLETILGRGSLLAYLVAMTSRIVELRRVLRPTGSLYLHCDAVTCHYLKVLLDAIFGPACFLNHVVWLYGLGGSSPRRWPRKHDDLLWYAREPGRHFFEASRVPATSARMKGRTKKAPDHWDIPAINNMARERRGYPTQKPEALLERIVESSSRPGGVVLDPCCGSGTTLVVAARLGRRWIGIDASPVAMEVTRRRLEEHDVPHEVRVVP